MRASAARSASIQFSLKDGDISIRKRALEPLFTMCDQTNAREIACELFKYLETVDYAICEELVLKISILGERFSPEGDKKWCVSMASATTVTSAAIGTSANLRNARRSCDFTWLFFAFVVYFVA